MKQKILVVNGDFLDFFVMTIESGARDPGGSGELDGARAASQPIIGEKYSIFCFAKSFVCHVFIC